MPSRPCPHCDCKFVNLKLLDIHVRHVHPEAAAHLPPQVPPQVPSPLQTQPSSAMTVDSESQIFVLRAAKPGVAPLPPGPPLPRKAKKGPNPQQQPGSTARCFKVVYEAKGYYETQRLEVPSTESYETFLGRMAQVSAPVAGSFIAGRATGFTKDDGPWKYSLVSKKLNIEQPGAALSSNIMYQAMISELLKAYSPWTWANLWHDVQEGPDLKGTKRKLLKMLSPQPSESAPQNTDFDLATPASVSKASAGTLTPSVVAPVSPVGVPPIGVPASPVAVSASSSIAIPASSATIPVTSPATVSASSVAIPAPPSAAASDYTSPGAEAFPRSLPPLPRDRIPSLNSERIAIPTMISAYGAWPPELQPRLGTLSRTVPAAAVSESGGGLPPLEPLPPNRSPVAPATAASERTRRLPPLEPLPPNRSPVAPATAASERTRRLPPLEPLTLNRSGVLPATAVLEDGRGLSPSQPLPVNRWGIVPAIEVSESGRGRPRLQPLPVNRSRIVPAAMVLERGLGLPPLQPLPVNRSRVEATGVSEHGRGLPLHQPFPTTRSRIVPAAIVLERGLGLPPLEPLLRNPSRVVPSTPVSQRGRGRPSLESLSRNPARPAAAAAGTPAASFHPLHINPLSTSPPSLYPYLSPNPFNRPPYHPSPPTLLTPTFLPPQPAHTQPFQPPHQHPHPHHSPTTTPSSRTPIQVIARRTDYARPTYLVQWVEPGVPQSWESEGWMREHGWGWILDDFLRRPS